MRRWKNYSTMDLIEIKYERMKWSAFAQGRSQWQFLVNTEMNLWVSKETGHFLASRDKKNSRFHKYCTNWVTMFVIPKISCSAITASAFGAVSTEITPRPATLHCGCPLDQRGAFDLHNACSRTVFPSELFALSCWHIHHGADYSARICSFVKSHTHIYHTRLSCPCYYRCATLT